VTLKQSELVKTNWEEFNKGHTYRREIVLHGKPCDVDEDCWLLPERFEVTFTNEKTRFGVRRTHQLFTDKKKRKILGEAIGYGHRTSWFIGMFFGPAAVGGWICSSLADTKTSLKDKIFTVHPDS
jgi:hypothetical protein